VLPAQAVVINAEQLSAEQELPLLKAALRFRPAKRHRAY
jgi:hypothetical protein